MSEHQGPRGAGPLVSIIIPTYNRSHFLRESVYSVLAQTFGDFELLILDDASTDDTPALCRELEALDSRIRTVRNSTNLGMVANANLGLDESRGKFFCRLDDDNRFLPKFLELSLKAICRTPDVVFSFADEWMIDEYGKRDHSVSSHCNRLYHRYRLRAGRVLNTPLATIRQSMGINSTVFRTDAVRRVGGFSSWLTAGLDFDLFLKLASANYTGTYIPERLIEYRIHPQQSTGTRVCSIAKSLDSVAMLQRARYEGEAETIRRQKLAFAYRSLSRTYVLDRDFSKARLAIRQAQTIFPNDLMTLAVAGILALPDSIVYDLTCYRFKRKLSASSGVTAMLPAFRGLYDSN